MTFRISTPTVPFWLGSPRQVSGATSMPAIFPTPAEVDLAGTADGAAGDCGAAAAVRGAVGPLEERVCVRERIGGRMRRRREWRLRPRAVRDRGHRPPSPRFRRPARRLSTCRRRRLAGHGPRYRAERETGPRRGTCSVRGNASHDDGALPGHRVHVELRGQATHGPESRRRTCRRSKSRRAGNARNPRCRAPSRPQASRGLSSNRVVSV